MDTVHAAFLHYGSESAATARGPFEKYHYGQRAAKFVTVETEYGLMNGAYRPAEDDTYYWRVTQILMPFYNMIPTGELGKGVRIGIYVPTDDNHVVFIGLERSGTVDYTERDRVLLGLAQAHLANARKLAHARTAARGELPPDPKDFERAGFSPRESEVLVWLTEGKTNGEMAKLLGVTLATIKFHLTAIFNKIGVGNRLAATLYALDLSKCLQRGADPRFLSVKLRS